MLETKKILKQIYLFLDPVRTLRFEVFQPFPRLVKCIDGVERMDPLISNDTDARRTGRQSNQPCPIAFSIQMIRARIAGEFISFLPLNIS